MENKETKVIPIEGAINIEKYYEAYPDGNGYIFNGHLHNDLLAECIKANYTLLEKQEECERLKNELLTYGATGICETCTEKSVSENDKLKSTIRCLEKDLSTADCIAETLKAQHKELQAENDSIKSELMQKNCYLDADKETIDQLKAELTRANCQIADDEILQCDMREVIEELKADNNELKVWKKEHLKDVEFLEKNPVIDILNSMADSILLKQRNDKLKQILNEIKEIAKYELNNLTESAINGGRYIEILQKINEVEE